MNSMLEKLLDAKLTDEVKINEFLDIMNISENFVVITKIVNMAKEELIDKSNGEATIGDLVVFLSTERYIGELNLDDAYHNTFKAIRRRFNFFYIETLIEPYRKSPYNSSNFI